MFIVEDGAQSQSRFLFRRFVVVGEWVVVFVGCAVVEVCFACSCFPDPDVDVLLFVLVSDDVYVTYSLGGVLCVVGVG